jgi:MFS family permease
MFIVAPISGRMADTYGSQILAVVGCSLIAGSLLLMGTSWGGVFEVPGQEQSLGNIIAHLCAMGAGFGIFQSPNSKAVLSDVETERLGMASALLATVRNLGLVTGTALSSMLLMSFYRSAAADNTMAPSGENFVLALRETFYLIGALTCIAIPTGALIGARTKKENP